MLLIAVKGNPGLNPPPCGKFLGLKKKNEVGSYDTWWGTYTTLTRKIRTISIYC